MRNNIKIPIISVLIATRNRTEKIKQCVTSLLKSSYTKYEICIVDQGEEDIQHLLLSLNPNIKYFHIPGCGKAKAINFGLTVTRGEVIAFTDDDCIVSKNWLKNIVAKLARETNLSGVFGRSQPYRPNSNIGYVCATSFTKHRRKTVRNPYTVHYKTLGIGNNMAIKKRVLTEVGPFKTWLGVGSISEAGGIESEIIYRMLKSGFELAFDPNIIVYHNRWISPYKADINLARYTCGLTAFHIYYLLLGDYGISQLLWRRYNESIVARIKYCIYMFKRFPLTPTAWPRSEMFMIMKEARSFIKGIFIGFHYFLIETFINTG